MHHDLPLVMYLGTQLFSSYCTGSKQPTRKNIDDYLLQSISHHLKVDIDKLPVGEVFYRAHNGKQCGSGTKEKMVLLLYLKTKPEQRETLLHDLLRIGHVERLTETPYWDDYKKEHANLADTPAQVVLTEPFEDCLLKCDNATVGKILQAVKKVAKKKGKRNNE
jgi:hypothetical protein